LQSSKGKAAPAKAAPKAAAAGSKAKPAPAKAAAAKGPVEDPLHPSLPKNFRIGNSVQHKRDLTRFVKWPRYVRIQRQKKVLYDRLKVPPSINQFRKALDRAEVQPLLHLLAKYKPETKVEKAARIKKLAEDKKAGKESKVTKPVVIKFGLAHVTTLVEQAKAKLVVIASDVDPIELVVWLPALCRKKGIPYAIVNNKGLLGQFVHQKKAAVLALTSVKAEDSSALDKVIETANAKFANNSVSFSCWESNGSCECALLAVFLSGSFLGLSITHTHTIISLPPPPVHLLPPPFPSAAGVSPQVGWRYHGSQDPEAPREEGGNARRRVEEARGPVNGSIVGSCIQCVLDELPKHVGPSTPLPP
jgi:large subunit ribosomal protein L7Ae